MYDARAAQFAPLREAYQKYLADMFTLIGANDAAQRAAAVYALEAKLAQTQWTRVQNRDPQKTYNKMTIAELQKLAPGVAWKPWLEAVGLDGQPSINVNQPSAIAGAAALVNSQPLAAWKAYLALQALTDAAPYLSRQLVDTRFEMFGKTLTGTPEIW
jgi:putative endopeptidase